MLLNESSKKTGEVQFSPVFCGLKRQIVNNFIILIMLRPDPIKMPPRLVEP